MSEPEPRSAPPPSPDMLPPGPPSATPPPGYPPYGHPPPPGYPPHGHPPPPGYPGYGYPPPYPYPYVAQPPWNTYAILSLVFAFAVFAPLGIYFGTKAKEQIAQTGERGIELANIGVIAGWILTCLLAAFLVVWCAFFVTFLGTAATQLPRTF